MLKNYSQDSQPAAIEERPVHTTYSYLLACNMTPNAVVITLATAVMTHDPPGPLDCAVTYFLDNLGVSTCQSPKYWSQNE